MASVYASPPLLTIVGGTPAVNLPQASGGVGGLDESSTSSSSIIIVIIVIASVVIVSASLYLILRHVSRRCRRSFRTYSVADEVFSSGDDSRGDRASHGQGMSQSDFIDSLPLFSFRSVTGNVAGGDCAVCLSKFELHDQLRLLPLCCHAFHADCIDTWLSSNQTCPLCRSTVHPTEPDVLNKILPSSAVEDRANSFRIEIGSISRRREPSDSGDGRRSYSIGSFEYIVDDGYEVSVESTHRRGVSDCSSIDKDSTDVATYQPEPPGQSLASEVSSGRSWLRDCVDRLAPFSLSSRALSFRSSRRSETVVPVEDLEANRIGEEISEMFRWLSGV